MSREFYIGVLIAVLLFVWGGCSARDAIQKYRTYQVERAMAKVAKHTPPRCAHLYNQDTHREWADCMGVGYR